MSRNVPKLRFKDFEDEWKEYRLGDTCNIYDGTHQTPKYTENGVKFVSVENIKNIYEDHKYISREDYITNFKIKPKRNDIFMTRITAGVIGETAIVDKEEELAYYVSLALIRTFDKNLNIRFLREYISSTYFKKELNKRIIHVAFPKKINLRDIDECKFKSPSLQEQEKIANFLIKADSIIEKQEKKVEYWNSYKKGMMQKIFSQKIRFKDENGRDYPEWESKRFKEILIEPKKEKVENPSKMELLTVKLHCKGVEKTGKYPNETKGGRPYYIRNEGELLIGRQNMHNGGIGLVKNECDGNIASNAISSFIIKNSDKDNIKYIYLFLSNSNFYKRIDLLIGGTGQKEISKSELDNLKIEISLLEEQNKIVKLFSNVDNIIEKENQKLEELKQWKKGLLQQMFV